MPAGRAIVGRELASIEVAGIVAIDKAGSRTTDIAVVFEALGTVGVTVADVVVTGSSLVGTTSVTERWELVARQFLEANLAWLAVSL